jgi:hypothetical protein
MHPHLLTTFWDVLAQKLRNVEGMEALHFSL